MIASAKSAARVDHMLDAQRFQESTLSMLPAAMTSTKWCAIWIAAIPTPPAPA